MPASMPFSILKDWVMKHNDILPECYIDSTLIASLLDAGINHKYSCSEVAIEMKKGKYRDSFAVGIIDNDKRQHSYAKEFTEICRTENLTFLKHKEKHQYLIKVGKPHKAMESFLISNVDAIGMKMEDFDLPSDLDALINITKDKISSQNDPRLLKLCKVLKQSPEVCKLKMVLEYLVSKTYNSDVEEIKNIVLK